MRNSRNHVLLVEILIAVLFFALCGTTILRVFAAAGMQSGKADHTDKALQIGSDMAELLYDAGADEAALTQLGFTRQDDLWVYDQGDYTVQAVPGSETASAGEIRTIQLDVLYKGESLIELPCARYMAGEAVQ